MKTVIRSFAILITLGVLASPARAATIYTDASAFASSVEAGFYLESFDSLAQNTGIPSPLVFSGGGFAYTAATDPGVSGFYNVGPAGDTWLSTDSGRDTILFTFTSSNVTAVGGDFFATDLGGGTTGASIVLTLNDGTIYNLLTSSATSFVGFTSTVPILSLSVDAPGDNQWATVNDLIVGATSVPEPGLLGLLGIAAIGVLRRRAAARLGD